MATTFKNLNSSDVANTRSILHESLVIPDGVIWNTYPVAGNSYPVEDNVQNLYSKMAQQIYDYSITNAAANHIFDISLGVHADSKVFYDALHTPPGTYNSARDANANKRKAMYNLLAQRLVGFGTDGEILLFDADGDFSGTTTDKYREVVVITFSRLTYKDEIKKGSFKLKLAMYPGGYDPGATSPTNPDTQYTWNNGVLTNSILVITDAGAEADYRVNSPSGEYGILYVEQGVGVDPIIEPALLDGNNRISVGLIFYQAGIVILNPYLFEFATAGPPNVGPGLLSIGGSEAPGDFDMLYDTTGDYLVPVQASAFYNIVDFMTGYGATNPTDNDLTITQFCDALRQRVYSIEFQNSIELNSTVYFCRVNHNEFNYSSNPSYLDGSRIRVKTNSMDSPVSYITGVGLYDSQNGLMATAKLSEPVKKSTDVDLTLRVRLDY